MKKKKKFLTVLIKINCTNAQNNNYLHQQSFFTEDILTYSRKSTGGSININDSCVTLSVPGGLSSEPTFTNTGAGSPKRNKAIFILLVTPVLFRLWRVKMSQH